MTPEEKQDLCMTCEHHWKDFPMPLEQVVSHCEMLDRHPIKHKSMDEFVSYPCTKCPFDSYKKKQS